jgi:transcriptional regulator with GAF, ATPase, and Fis domain/tetratricopeptide (TPR) repeat protein
LERVAEGATAVVWCAHEVGTGQRVALKLARSVADAVVIARESALAARAARRWGPALVDAGAGFAAFEWMEGSALDLRGADASGNDADRIRLAALVAHGVGRGLEELHQAGFHHGDVKPANVVLRPHRPTRDAADDRAVTLIDLGLAAAPGSAIGGTRRYAAPELYAAGEGGPAADMWSLGVLLAEVLHPELARSEGPVETFRAIRAGMGASEPERWVDALLATFAGGRPSAGWLSARAASFLGLELDEGEAERSRCERVRRTYLRERARDLVAGAALAADITGPARAWLEEAIAWEAKLTRAVEGRRPLEISPPVVTPLSPLRRARWLVALIGPSAASWSMRPESCGEGELVTRALELARVRDPAAWTRTDLFGSGAIAPGAAAPMVDEAPSDRAARLVRELGQPEPRSWAIAAAEEDVARAGAPPSLALQLASSLVRAGEIGRAWAALRTVAGPEADALRAEIARRRGDQDQARTAAQSAVTSVDEVARWRGLATLARLAWEAGELDRAEQLLEGAGGPAVAEVRGLVAWRRGDHERGIGELESAALEAADAEGRARIEGTRGLLELARGSSERALEAFSRAVELASRSGALVEEATYLTSYAAAAADAGDTARALTSATRAALLWERFGRPERAARAWLARAGALAVVGAAHAVDEAAEEARRRGLEANDVEAVAYARWAQVEVRPPGDPQARAWSIEARDRLRGAGPEHALRAAARLLGWAPDALDARERAAMDQAADHASAPSRWEWWGARAHALVRRAIEPGDDSVSRVLSALLSLVDVPAPLGARGPALDAAMRLATSVGDGAAARRFDAARLAVARVLRDGAPAELRISLGGVAWARDSLDGPGGEDVTFAPAQVAQLEAIVRALSSRDRLRPLLEQVLDTLVLWTGVERGLLLLPAPDGRLVVRAARNLARHDLTGDQLALSHTIARRAIETGDAVVATDALASLGDVHASVHALKLRSVLAVPLQARGESIGVVYLDDRGRKGAFGPQELAWVRVVASQAAMAIADARDAVLLRRSARRAERARARVEAMLQEREAELHVTRVQLESVHDSRETRHRYDEIAGRSEPMRELLRLVDRVTASDVPVLLFGESGTGKELVARAVHNNGARARRPFVTENCASVPESLLESTLFGHVRGAFTGASATRAGLFDVADGGTLFLDEIGEMSMGMQSKLLRVLQEGEVRAVGGERVRKVDVRVIAATHRDLSAMVAAGSFREDLFYRLNVITLRVPALRERAEDIPLLVAHFVQKHVGRGAAANETASRSVKVTRAAMAKLTAFAWPGNVRQLENEIRRALVLGEGAIDVVDLSEDVVRGGPPSRGTGLDLRARVDALEVELVREALVRTRGNQTKAANLLGLSRFGLQKMMKRLGVKPTP